MVLVAAVGEPVPADVDGLLRAQGAGEHADQGDAADVGVGGGLDDLGDERARRIAGDGRARGAVGGGDGDGRAFLGGGEAAGDQFEEFDGAQALAGALGGGGGHQDGVEGAPGDRPLQVVDQGLDVDVLAAEVAVHEALVLALGDDPLDQPGAGAVDQGQLGGVRIAFGAFPGGVVVDAPGQQADQAGDGGVAVRSGGSVEGEVERDDGVGVLGAEGLAADGGHLGIVGPGCLHMGDDDGAGHADGLALLPDHAGGAVDAVGGGDDEEGGVGRAQTGPEFPDEVGVSGGVQDVDLDSGPLDGDQGELDGALAAVLDLVVVRDGAPVLDPAGLVHGPRGQGEGLDEGGFAGAAVADQHDVPYGRGAVGRQCPAGGSGLV